MSEQDKPLPTETFEDLKARKSSLSELLRVGADENAMLLGTPPAPEGEETGDAAAATPARSKEEAPSIPETNEFAPLAARTNSVAPSGRGAIAGLAVSIVGVLILVGAQVSPAAAEALQRYLDPRVLGGIFVVGGLILFTLGVLRSTLSAIQTSVDDVAVETARLEKIATDSRSVLDALHTVRLENTTLKDDVVKLQAKIKKLTEIVSNPDYAGSIFRLAASVDLLGKHVEVYMKEQFGAVHQRLSAVAQQTERAEQQLKSALAQVQTLTKEQLKAQQTAVQEGFERQHATSDKAAARLEQGLQVTARIEATIKSQQEAIAKGWANLAERFAQSASQVGKDIKDLRVGIDRQVEAQTATLRTELDGIDAKIGASEKNQTAGILQLSEHVQGQLTASLVDLQQGLKLLADLASSGHQEIAVEFDELGARLDQQAESQASALDAGFGKLDARIGAAERGQGAGIQELAEVVRGKVDGGIDALGARLDRMTESHATYVDAGIEKLDSRIGAAERGQSAGLQQLTDLVRGEIDGGIQELQKGLRLLAELASKSQQEVTQEIEALGGQIDKSAREAQGVLLQAREKTIEDFQQAVKSFADLAGKGQRQVGAGIEELGTRLEKQGREQQATLQQVRDRSTEATRTAKSELAAILEQLRVRVEELGRDHAAAIDRSSQDARDGAGATRVGLAEGIEQIGARLEKALEARTRSLTGEMTEVAQSVRSITSEVRSCIAESMLRAASSSVELAASRGRDVEWPRIGVEEQAQETAKAEVPAVVVPETPSAPEAAEVVSTIEIELGTLPLLAPEPAIVPEEEASVEPSAGEPRIESSEGVEPPFGTGLADSTETQNS